MTDLSAKTTAGLTDAHLRTILSACDSHERTLPYPRGKADRRTVDQLNTVRVAVKNTLILRRKGGDST